MKNVRPWPALWGRGRLAFLLDRRAPKGHVHVDPASRWRHRAETQAACVRGCLGSLGGLSWPSHRHRYASLVQHLAWGGARLGQAVPFVVLLPGVEDSAPTSRAEPDSPWSARVGLQLAQPRGERNASPLNLSRCDPAPPSPPPSSRFSASGSRSDKHRVRTAPASGQRRHRGL